MLDGEPRRCITVWDTFSDLPKEALESVSGKLMPVGTEFFCHITKGFSGFEKHMELAHYINQELPVLVDAERITSYKKDMYYRSTIPFLIFFTICSLWDQTLAKTQKTS